MEAIKTSENVEFDVIYADGTRHHVAEGVLFEVENERIVFHNGTNRANVLFATLEAIIEVIELLGLANECAAYLNRKQPEEEKPETELRCCETCKHEIMPGRPCEKAEEYDCLACNWEECICTGCHDGSKWERRN